MRASINTQSTVTLSPSRMSEFPRNLGCLFGLLALFLSLAHLSAQDFDASSHGDYWYWSKVGDGDVTHTGPLGGSPIKRTFSFHWSTSNNPGPDRPSIKVEWTDKKGSHVVEHSYSHSAPNTFKIEVAAAEAESMKVTLSKVGNWWYAITDRNSLFRPPGPASPSARGWRGSIVDLEDQAFAADPIYATTAAGIAATSENAQFKVENADPDIAFDVYSHDAGAVATLVASVPAGSSLANKADQSELDSVRSKVETRYPLSDPSYNKFDKERAVPNAYLNTSTGQPVTSVNAARWMTEFMFVKGVTFIASNTFGTGPMLAYDENKDFISVVPNTDGGQIGRYVLPANTVYVRASGLNPDNVYMYLDDFSRFGTHYDYGVTLADLGLVDANAEIETKARVDYVKTLNIPDGVNVLDPDTFTAGFTINALGQVIAHASNGVSEFLYCKGRSYANTNMFMYGGIYAYEEDYTFISAINRNTDTGFFDIPANAAYIRGVFPTALNGQQYLYWDAAVPAFYPFLQDRFNYKYKGKKLVTLGDSITYQKSWQPRLVELTGMVWDVDETRGGVGFVEIDATTNADLGNYVREDAAIVDSGSTYVNDYGETLTIYEKGAQRFRAAYSAAEGGDTVMPRSGSNRSLYSRCGDIKHYEPDVIIIHGGANDRGLCNWLPTNLPNGRLSDITGITNLESDDPDLVADYEIHTAEAKYTDTGDFTAEGDTQGTRRQSGTFRAAYRGMLKKVIDGTPDAIIFLIQPPRTFLYGDTYQNKVSQYVADEVNRVIAEVGKEFGCQVIDTSQIFGTYNASQWFTADGQYVHPNRAGGRKIADYIASQIE